MLTFLSIFFLFLLGSTCVTYVLYSAIQPDEVFGKWQRVLDWLYQHNWPLLEKFLGGCYRCFSHMVAIGAFIIYVITNKYFFETSYGWWYILWYIIFVPMSITASMIVNGIVKTLNNDPAKQVAELKQEIETLKELLK